MHCNGKPVIYLYPDTDTVVSVKLTIPGVIITSYPQYPLEAGWENILAHPGGTLSYQGKTYHELYYESLVKNLEAPPTGTIINTSDLKEKLISLTGKLGLLPIEQQEFLQYWLPKLSHLQSRYILFSILTPSEKDAIDHVAVTPKPDTLIQFIAYFKPLQFPVTIEPLQLQDTPPQRHGFTVVEWGGTIDH